MEQPFFSIDNYRGEDSAGHMLALAHIKLVKALGRALASHRPEADISTAELARELHINSTSLTRAIDRLERRGLVLCEHSLRDRRIVFLRLTPAGRHLSEQLPPLYVEALNKSFSRFRNDKFQ